MPAIYLTPPNLKNTIEVWHDGHNWPEILYVPPANILAAFPTDMIDIE